MPRLSKVLVQPKTAASRAQIMEVFQRVMEKFPGQKNLSPEMAGELSQGLENIPPDVSKTYGVLRDLSKTAQELPDQVRLPINEARAKIFQNPQGYEVPAVLPTRGKVIGQVPAGAPEEIVPGLGYYEAVTKPALPYRMTRLMQTLQGEDYPVQQLPNVLLQGEEVWKVVQAHRRIFKSLWNKIVSDAKPAQLKGLKNPQEYFVASYARKNLKPVEFGRFYPKEAAFIDSIEGLAKGASTLSLEERLRRVFGE